jgi:hypothetical protein
MDNILTVITPTTGKKSLDNLIDSIESQDFSVVHMLLWDNKREEDYLYPDTNTLKAKDPYAFTTSKRYSIIIPFNTVQGRAYGSTLRSIGLMSVQTPYVTFADDDVVWEKHHVKTMLLAIEGHQWAYCRRKIWSSNKEYIGIDNFESVGDSLDRKVPYEMVDNNCMIFSRRLGSSGAVIYREVDGQYNDDRQFYAFLKNYAGVPGKTSEATVNQTCPLKLESMFRQHCSK